MLLHLRSTPTITLMLILTALTRLWIGRLFSVSVTPFCSLSNSVDLYVFKYSCGLLYRFAQFFIKPLMSSDATTREIKAVDSGYHFCFALLDAFISSTS